MFPFPNPLRTALFGEPFGGDLDLYSPFSPLPIFSSGSHHQVLLPQPCLQPALDDPLVGSDNSTAAAAADGGGGDPPLTMRRKAPNLGCRARGLRRDRHSKIVTATGLRDRRIRLSREVAREFFDLQETLGFDHGSETVQWLLTMCADAIHQLITPSSAATPPLLGLGGEIPQCFAENASSSMASAGVDSFLGEKQAIIEMDPSLILERERARMCWAFSSSGSYVVGDGGLSSSLLE